MKQGISLLLFEPPNNMGGACFFVVALLSIISA